MFRRGNPCVRAREETSSTHGASHLLAGLSLSWPSHVHIQPNLLKSCHGKPTREWLTREDTASPTAALESIMLTAVIDAHEGRDVMCVDIPNAFIQAEMPDISVGEEWVTMKITGVLVSILPWYSYEEKSSFEYHFHPPR